MSDAAQRNSIAQALRAWTALLGADRVLSAGQAMERFCPSTEGLRCEIAGALLARSADDVAQIIRIAAQYRTSLYPISTGHNWGYGTAQPTRDGSLLLDLSAMDRILDFDAGTGVVTIEPGVTQGQLAEYLAQHGGGFLVPTTGAGPKCSVLANALERGYGITPYCDHFGAVMRLEAVLADGTHYRPALTGIGASKVDRLYKWGLGPYVDGLFSQSGFGVVTQITLALARQPRTFSGFFFGSNSDAAVGELVGATRALMARLPGIVGSINLMNAHRILAMTIPYPFDLTVEGVLPVALIKQLRQRHKIFAWTGAGALYGEPAVVAAASKTVARTLGPLVQSLHFLNAGRASIVRRVSRVVPGDLGRRLRRNSAVLDGAIDIMRGRPSEVALRLAYWKSGKLPDAGTGLDPARDGCGLIWYPPLVPAEPDSARDFISHVTATCEEYRIEPLITLTALSDRCLDSSVPILFDPLDPTQTASALTCYDQLIARGLAKGYAPYRLNIGSMQLLAARHSDPHRFVRRLKEAIDPFGILAPGRYDAVR